jgi:hypothetical protein
VVSPANQTHHLYSKHPNIPNLCSHGDFTAAQAGFVPGEKGELYRELRAAARKVILQRFKVPGAGKSPENDGF